MRNLSAGQNSKRVRPCPIEVQASPWFQTDFYAFEYQPLKKNMSISACLVCVLSVTFMRNNQNL